MTADHRERMCGRAAWLTERSAEVPLTPGDRDWLAEHLAACPDCADSAEAVKGRGEVWQALDQTGPADDPPDGGPIKAAILAHLRGEPVATMRLSRTNRILVAVVGVAFTALCLLMAGMRPDLTQQPSALVTVPATLMFGGFLLGLVLFDSRRKVAIVTALVGGAAACALFVVTSLMIEPSASSVSGAVSLSHSTACGTLGLAVALSALVPAVVLARKNLAGPTTMGAISLGLLCAALGVSGLQIGCAMVDRTHLLVGHGSVFIFGVIAALLLRRVRGLS